MRRTVKILLVVLLSAAAAIAEPLRGPPVSDLGGRCGGATLPAPVCNPDKSLTCLMPAHPRPGQAGVCVPLARIGQRCGGNIRYPAQCSANAQCVYEKPLRIGAFGTCKEVVAKDRQALDQTR